MRFDAYLIRLTCRKKDSIAESNECCYEEDLMKRNSAIKKLDLKLKRRLELVRTTVRQLTPTELRQVNGGETENATYTCPTKTCNNCGCEPYTY